MDGNIVAQLFPGIASLMVQDTTIAIARIALIAFGFILAYLGFKRTLEPLIMVPMGVGMICINCGVLFLDGGKLGTLFLDPLVSDPAQLVDIMQINFLQPIYNLTFSNSLVACVVFMGVGAMCEIGFILGNPWTSIIIAIFAECGTFVTLVLGVHLGLTPPEAAAVASIGGADGPMVLFTSLMLAPHLFVPISVPVSVSDLCRLSLAAENAGSESYSRQRHYVLCSGSSEIQKIHLHSGMLRTALPAAADGCSADYVLLPGHGY